MPESNKTDFTRRAVIVLLILIMLGFGTCIVYLGYVQLVKGEEYRAKAELNQLLDTEISAERGVIYDRNMKELAKSASAWKVIIYPDKIENDYVRGVIVKRLGEILVDKERDGSYTPEALASIEKSIKYKAEQSGYGYLVVKNRIEKDVRDQVIELTKDIIETKDGKTAFSQYIGIESDVKRYYPYGTFASTVIGFTGIDDIGRAGLELNYNSLLTGTNGRIITAKNGGNASMPVEYETEHDAIQGTSLVTTLDETIQRYLEESLSQTIDDTSAQSAYGIVMDVKTGAILAMSSKPDYDSNDPYTITDSRIIKQLEEMEKEKDDKRDETIVNAQYSQWRNRTISDTYEPGSVFKIVTAAAALEENIWNETDTYNCTGYYTVEDRQIGCSHTSGHGIQTFKEAFANSCNPFFINIGLKMGKDIFFKYFEAFGLTASTGIDLPAEAAPVENVTYHGLSNLSTVDLASSSFGQSFRVSPIQMLTAVSAIANGGYIMQPYIVSKMLDENGNVIKQVEPIKKRQVASKSTCEKITEMMEAVVSEGTGINGYVAGYRVAGKTGTSEKLGDENKGKYVGSFVCFAPADDPQVAMLIAVDEPKGMYYGSQVAAPVAAVVMQKIMTYMSVEPEYNEEEQEYAGTTASNVMGKDIADAKNTLEGEGFNVKVVGEGKTVLEQAPASNQQISKGGMIILYTEKTSEKLKAKVPYLVGYSVSGVYQMANYAGINVKIVGNGYNTSGFVSYKQSIESGTEVNYGDTVTVYFKSNSADTD